MARVKTLRRVAARGAAALIAISCVSISSGNATDKAAHDLAQRFSGGSGESPEQAEPKPSGLTEADRKAHAPSKTKVSEKKTVQPDPKTLKAEEDDMLKRARLEAEERREAARKAAEQEEAEEARLAAEQRKEKEAAEQQKEKEAAEERKALEATEARIAKDIEEKRLAAEQRKAEAAEQRKAEERRLAEEHRVAEEKRQADEQRAAEEKRLADEKLVTEQLRQAEERRLAAEQREAKEADERRTAEERRVAEEKRLADEKRAAEEQQIAEDKRRAEEQRKIEEAAEQRAAEEKRIAEEKRAAEEARLAAEADTKAMQDAAEKRLAEQRLRVLERDREEEARRLTAKLNRIAEERMKREAEAAGKPDPATPPAQLPKTYGVASEPKSVTEPKLPLAETVTAPVRSLGHVTILLVMDPGTNGIRRFGKKTADPVICAGASCWASSGPDHPSAAMPRGKALGPGNTLGRRAGACNESLTCIFRDVDLGSNPQALQPIDLRVMRHDRREPLTVAASGRCEVAGTQLYCSDTFKSRTWRAWIVPESLAERAGPGMLKAAVDGGLSSARAADLRATLQQ